ncbi:formate dehydrogenase accessory sulfurtransferase FdhD [Sphingomonas solaris]|uniref:Sulfur carrier protein FdhD n=2 Tax=Alterirhizorhabdus solaris TaxID=2529389 RepID=A0A558QUB4_9SPHN|nr:formate dehydrogenase accessory sulfurtransferase FdhD [Sphingomonas solaris]TVV70733.1 formate dehydrogenase accessory sulfurtransferase FdhD [Sphingomonas solaris]
MDNTADRPFIRLAPDAARAPLTRAVAVEMPVAVEANGLGYAVMMATPADLADFACGFALAERLVDAADEIVEIDHHDTGNGLILRLTLIPERADRVIDRVRHRVAESSCGLCGLENLEQALRPLPPVTAISTAPDAAIFAALAALRDHQPLNRATGAAHAAALCGADGTIRLAREDVGRHNAFDKLIGAMRRGGLDWDGGFALLSARCSYELVEKAVLAGCPMLVTVSAPTSLALDRAGAAGLRLVALARADAALEAAPAAG